MESLPKKKQRQLSDALIISKRILVMKKPFMSLIKCDWTDHHGPHHIISYSLKGDEEINTRFQRDLYEIINPQ